MRTYRTVLASLTLTVLALTTAACSTPFDQSDDSAPLAPSASASGPVNGEQTTENPEQGLNDSPVEGLLPNTDKALYKLATPCELLNVNDLSTLFGGLFSKVDDDDPTNGNDSPITDKLNQQRACGFISAYASVDEGNRSGAADMQLTLTTEIDNVEGTIWEGCKTSAGLNSGNILDDHNLTFGKSTYVTKIDRPNGAIIVEINDINGELNRKGARDILDIVRKRLS